MSTGTESAERVADVLLTLSRTELATGVSAIARDLNLSKAVVHRILQSLASRDLVSINPTTREYSLGPSATAMGARALRQLDLSSLASDDLIELRNVTGETTTLSLLVVDKRAYIDQYESVQEIRMTVETGRLFPLYAGASGRAILAYLPTSGIEKIIASGLKSLTDETVNDFDVLNELLIRVRTKGYATSRGERQAGAGSVAAPVFREDGKVIGSVSVCGPLARFDQESVEKYVPLVTAAAARISARLT